QLQWRGSRKPLWLRVYGNTLSAFRVGWMEGAILAGGLGARLAEGTDPRPQPLGESCSQPTLWHIIEYYFSYWLNEFIIGLGHKKEAIIRYFLDLQFYSSDLTIRNGDGTITVHDQRREPDWIVHLVDTGLLTNTGGRIKRLAPYIGSSTFMLT